MSEKIIEVKHQNLQDAIKQAYSEENKGKDVIIYLDERRYHIRKSICIDAKQMSRIASITFRGAGADKTKLCGTVTIHPKWKLYKGAIYVAQIEKDLSMDGLLCGGRMQIMARYPNYDEMSPLYGCASDAIDQERTERWMNPVNGYIRALHPAEWGGNSFVITGKNNAGGLMYRWVGDNNRGSGMHPTVRMVENIFEELDAVKEWYYLPETGELYFYPEEKADLDCEFEAVINGELFRIEGESTDSPICHITFEGIGFEHTARTLFTGEYERVMRSDWGIVRSGVIYMENAKNVSVIQCTFHQIGGNAITMSGYNEGHLVDGNDFTQIGASGVLIAGRISAVRDPSCYDDNNHKTMISDYAIGPQSEDYPRKIDISNNYFYDIGICECQTAAVGIFIASDITIRANTVHHTTRAGISINTGNFGGHLLEDNDIFDCVTWTGDHGPFNSWGRDRFWSVPEYDTMGKFGKEKRAFALLDAYKTTVIRHNRIYGHNSFGIDLDDGSTNYDIYNNLCLNLGIKLREGFDRKVHNNLLIGADINLHVAYANNNDLIYSNIIYNSTAYTRIAGSDEATTIFTRNLYWNDGEDIIGIPKEEYEQLIADPCFVDPEQGDYHLNAQSPAFLQGFVEFPIEDEAFGRKDAPKPPFYRYQPIKTETREYHFYDLVLKNIEGEGHRSAAGLPDYNGAYVVKMSNGYLGCCGRLGLPLREGDVIVGVRSVGNWTEIKDCEAALEVLERLQSGMMMEFDIYRNQKLQTLQFVIKNS